MAQPMAAVIGSYFKKSEIAFAAGVLAIMLILLLPMPTWLLDFSLAISIGVSLLILMTTLFVERPIDLTSFPMMLLIATMLRLSLNVASTRLILSKGHEGTNAAGHVIKAFGSFVMGGNFVIGLIIFAILIIINFVVITKGSGRIAEVSARFSLDAMPGKQMAIDADLSAGILTEQDAKKRREELEEESNFYGAMDGAAKFVRGDAIAGILITAINIIGGILIGVMQKNISLSAAAHSYTVLTVGDGLVSQIPGLIVSTAAGMVVSKGATKGAADKALSQQLGAYPLAFAICAILLTVMGVLPGLPFIPFAALGGVVGYFSYLLMQQKEEERVAKEEKAQAPTEKTPAEMEDDELASILGMDNITLELGYGLLTYVDEKDEENLSVMVKKIRKQLAREFGFVLPAVRIQDNSSLGTYDYNISMKEVEIAAGKVYPAKFMVFNPGGNSIDLMGEDTKDNTFGLDAKWVDNVMRATAEDKAYTVVEPKTVLVTHFTESIKDSMSDLLTMLETQKLLNGLEETHQKLLTDNGNTVTKSNIHRVLQNLLRERISIRDLPGIIEAIVESGINGRQVDALTEYVRSRMSRQICAQLANEEGVLELVMLSNAWEEAFMESLVKEGDRHQLAMSPENLREFVRRLDEVMNSDLVLGRDPVLVTGPMTRAHVRTVVERVRPMLPVLSQNEIHAKAKVQTLAQI